MRGILAVVCLLAIPLLALPGWAAAELTIFDVRKNLPLSDSDPVFRDFYINGGSEKGLSPGMVITVTRKLPLYDTYLNRSAGDLELRVARVKIIHAQKGLAVARLHSEFSREQTPLLEDGFILMGDRLDLSSATMDKGERKSAAKARAADAEAAEAEKKVTEEKVVDKKLVENKADNGVEKNAEPSRPPGSSAPAAEPRPAPVEPTPVEPTTSTPLSATPAHAAAETEAEPATEVESETLGPTPPPEPVDTPITAVGTADVNGQILINSVEVSSQERSLTSHSVGPATPAVVEAAALQ
ncbi:MAG: hypothetical protein AB7G93_17175 [Bdellovibrionales bacterium]